MAGNLESVLREELMRADRAVAGIVPLLGQMIESGGQNFISDALIARIAGMLRDIADHLAHEIEEPAARSILTESLGDMLTQESDLVSYLYKVALEAELTKRLADQSVIEPVFSPLLEEQISSSNTAIAEAADAIIAAQSSFWQFVTRGGFAFDSLPADQREKAITLRDAVSAQANAAIRASSGNLQDSPGDRAKDPSEPVAPSASRVDLLIVLLEAMGDNARLALDVERAGFALFVTALAGFSGQSRASTILACHPHQAARLAVSLRAAGLATQDIQAQFSVLEPVELLPPNFDELSIDAARAILTSSIAQKSG